MCDDFALYGGNSDNRTHVGTLYCNLNNTVSNANWNNGAAQSYLIREQNQMHIPVLSPWRK